MRRPSIDDIADIVVAVAVLATLAYLVAPYLARI